MDGDELPAADQAFPHPADLGGAASTHVVDHSIDARFTPDSGVRHRLGSATGKRRPLVIVGMIRMNRGLSPACHGKSGRSMVSIRSWPLISSAFPLITTLHASP